MVSTATAEACGPPSTTGVRGDSSRILRASSRSWGVRLTGGGGQADPIGLRRQDLDGPILNATTAVFRGRGNHTGRADAALVPHPGEYLVQREKAEGGVVHPAGLKKVRRGG
jgi:hypothetical protein